MNCVQRGAILAMKSHKYWSTSWRESKVSSHEWCLTHFRNLSAETWACNHLNCNVWWGRHGLQASCLWSRQVLIWWCSGHVNGSNAEHILEGHQMECVRRGRVLQACLENQQCSSLWRAGCSENLGWAYERYNLTMVGPWWMSAQRQLHKNLGLRKQKQHQVNWKIEGH